MHSTTLKRSIYLFAVPSLILYVIFWIVPIIMTFYLSFTKSTLTRLSTKFVGLTNYKYILEDGTLLNAVSNTLIYAVIFIIGSNVMAIILALLLNTGLKYQGAYRTLCYIPTLFSTVVVAFVWGYVYMPQDGMLAVVLKSMGLSGLDPNLLAYSSTALVAIAIVEIWKGIGGTVVIYLAGLQSVSVELIEAGKIDGCNSMQSIWYIKLPLLAPSITINLTMGLISGLKVFDYVFLMTQGGPNQSTETLMTSVFRTSFTDELFGKGSALGVCAFLLIFLITAVAVGLLKKREVLA